MADNVFRMYCYSLFILLIINQAFCSLVVEKEEKPCCCCYDLCDKNFTSNAIKDVQKLTACQRGCRFYSLVLHVSHEQTPPMDFAHANEGCLISCTESYNNPDEVMACSFGCSAASTTKLPCDNSEFQLPQIMYSVLIEESDVLIHPGDAEPDDVLTDPGLRKQFEKTLEVLLDSKPKLPEIHFRNLPITNEKSPEHTHVNFKCPKFYGFDPKFEFRNGKMIIGDLYLFVGVFGFVVICFLIGHHVETKNMTKQLLENRMSKMHDEYSDKEPLLNVDLMDDEDNVEIDEIIEVSEEKEASVEDNEMLESNQHTSDNIDPKFESITLVFHDEDRATDVSIKM